MEFPWKFETFLFVLEGLKDLNCYFSKLVYLYNEFSDGSFLIEESRLGDTRTVGSFFSFFFILNSLM